MSTSGTDSVGPEPSRPRRGFPRSAIVMFIAMVVLYLWTTRAAPPLEGWGNDHEVAMASAASTGRKVLIAFTMRGCAPCRRMERSVLGEAPVVEALDGFIPIHLDAYAHSKLADRYGVMASPTYVIVDAKGEVSGKITGYFPVKEFVAFLNAASEGSKTPPSADP